MRRVWLLPIALAALVHGCEKAPTADPSLPVSAPAKSALQPDTVPLPATGRRERAGIDLADGAPALRRAPKTPRRPAAEFIVATPAATVPPIKPGPRAADVARAIRWIDGVWKPAALADDITAYAALLARDFRGDSAGLDRDAWAKARTPAVGTPTSWGPPSVTANPSPLGRLMVEMREATGDKESCRVGVRTLMLQPSSAQRTSPWLVVMEERSRSADCQGATTRNAVEAHEALRGAWRSRDTTALKAAVHGGFTLRDGGVDAARYNVAALSAGPGRWILDLVEQTTATPENTRLTGDEAVVTAANGTLLGYMRAGDIWRLGTVWRPATAP